MPWPDRNLPPDWARRRRAVFDRDAWRCVDCGSPHNLECDHIGDRDDHRIESLATRCKGCHARRTKQQAAAGRAAMPKARRTPERHPGLR